MSLQGMGSMEDKTFYSITGNKETLLVIHNLPLRAQSYNTKIGAQCMALPLTSVVCREGLKSQ